MNTGLKIALDVEFALLVVFRSGSRIRKTEETNYLLDLFTSEFRRLACRSFSGVFQDTYMRLAVIYMLYFLHFLISVFSFKSNL